jgi:hypothetical protein
MYLKRYTIAAFALMAAVGGYVYFSISKGTTSIDFFGIPLPSLSIALWVVIPLFILYIATILHISFYSFLGSMNTRKYEKDYDKVLDLIVDAYLGKKDREHHFKTPPYSLLGKLLDNSTIFPNNNITFKYDSEKTQKMSEVLNLIEDIKNGKVVDLKQHNLQMDNPLVIQNERNRYKSGELKAEDILSNSVKYDESLNKEVYSDFVKTATLVNIEKYKALMTKESLNHILSRVNADSFTLEVPNETIIKFLEFLDFSKDEYIKLSSHISQSHMIPEQRIRLFETLSDENDDVVDAYLYTLFDLEMITAVDEILNISQPDEYQNFKAYRALKECQKNFSIEIFV